MRKSEHRHYMTSTVWQLRKQRYFETYRRQCVACGTTQGQIDLHHITYARAPGQEEETPIRQVPAASRWIRGDRPNQTPIG